MEAAIVQRIFEDYAAGKSPRQIAHELNAEGVPGPGGRVWGDTTIRGQVDRGTGILNNTLYVGRLSWNRCSYVAYSVDPDQPIWVLPRFWCRAMLAVFSTRHRRSSCCGKNTAPKEVVFGTTIHGPLQQLQPVDLAFDRTGAPGFNEGGQYRVMVALDTPHEAIEHRSFCIGQPSFERRSVCLVRRASDEGREAGCQVASTARPGCHLGQVGKEQTLWRSQLIGRPG